MPNLLENLFGWEVGHEYPAITSIMFLLILFYGADFAYRRISKLVDGGAIRKQLDGLVSDVALQCNVSEDKLRSFLESRYGRGKVRHLVDSALKVFRPSKQHSNAAIRVNNHRIESRTVAEVPGDAEMTEFDPAPESKPMQNVEIELHAQDIDHAKQGWAAVVPAVSKNRIRVELYPTIKPADIYTKTKIKGDVIIMYRQTAKGDHEPFLCHLVRLVD